MAAEYLKIVRFESGSIESLFNYCLEIAEQSGFKILKRNETEKKIMLSVPMSFWSWGEKISIEFHRINSWTEIELRSECKLVYQVIDWGKNRRNIDKILQVLRSKIA